MSDEKKEEIKDNDKDRKKAVRADAESLDIERQKNKDRMAVVRADSEKLEIEREKNKDRMAVVRADTEKLEIEREKNKDRMAVVRADSEKLEVEREKDKDRKKVLRADPEHLEFERGRDRVRKKKLRDDRKLSWEEREEIWQKKWEEKLKEQELAGILSRREEKKKDGDKKRSAYLRKRKSHSSTRHDNLKRKYTMRDLRESRKDEQVEADREKAKDAMKRLRDSYSKEERKEINSYELRKRKFREYWKPWERNELRREGYILRNEFTSDWHTFHLENPGFLEEEDPDMLELLEEKAEEIEAIKHKKNKEKEEKDKDLQLLKERELLMKKTEREEYLKESQQMEKDFYEKEENLLSLSGLNCEAFQQLPPNYFKPHKPFFDTLDKSMWTEQQWNVFESREKNFKEAKAALEMKHKREWERFEKGLYFDEPVEDTFHFTRGNSKKERELEKKFEEKEFDDYCQFQKELRKEDQDRLKKKREAEDALRMKNLGEELDARELSEYERIRARNIKQLRSEYLAWLDLQESTQCQESGVGQSPRLEW